MATCTVENMVALAGDFCLVTSDPYWLAKLGALRVNAGLSSSTAQEIIELAKCHIAQWGMLKGLEIYMSCVAAG